MTVGRKSGRTQLQGSYLLNIASRLPGRRRLQPAEQLPLLPLCNRVLNRVRIRPQDRQVLILASHDGGLRSPAPHDTLRIHFVRLSADQGIEHPDLLLALCMGVTHILWQQAPAGTGARAQRQERQVCEYLGGQGRITLFSTSDDLRAALADLAFLPLEEAPVPAGQPPVRETRRDTARACGRFLLSNSQGPVPLPDFAPYGRVQIAEDACSGCHSCVWLCPVNALVLTPGSRGISLRESDCIQCGMCRAACPEAAIELQPRLNLDRAAERLRPAQTEAQYPCSVCCAPVAPLGIVERVLERLKSGSLFSATVDAALEIRMCSTCRTAGRRGTEADHPPSACGFPALDG